MNFGGISKFCSGSAVAAEQLPIHWSLFRIHNFFGNFLYILLPKAQPRGALIEIQCLMVALTVAAMSPVFQPILNDARRWGSQRDTWFINCDR